MDLLGGALGGRIALLGGVFVFFFVEFEEEDDDDDAPRVRDIDVPPDPSDHEVAAAPGLLTLLTAPKTRDLGLSAEQIETLIVRVRDHARAMSHAARN